MGNKMLNVKYVDGRLKKAKPIRFFSMFGFKFFVHRDVDNPSKYAVSEFLTGRAVVRRYDSINAALAKSKNILKSYGKKRVHGRIKEVIEKDGLANKDGPKERMD